MNSKETMTKLLRVGDTLVFKERNNLLVTAIIDMPAVRYSCKS